MLETYLKVLDLAYFEVKEAFSGLADENVWRRPAEGLLSIGELAGHIAYWQANKMAGEGPGDGKLDLSKCRIQSPLIDHRFGYYTNTLETAPSEEHLAMTAEQVCAELLRVHAESTAYFKSLDPDLEKSAPGWPTWNTYGFFLSYGAFHVSYHTGQMYTARHLLGEATPDN